MAYGYSGVIQVISSGSAGQKCGVNILYAKSPRFVVMNFYVKNLIFLQPGYIFPQGKSNEY